MSASEAQRLLRFELAGQVYGLPIGAIFEVVEAGEVCGVPTLPSGLAGVMNWHGEALPVVAPGVLVCEANDAVELPEAPRDVTVARRTQQVLVISDCSGDAPKLGLPVDAVRGLADASNDVCADAGTWGGAAQASFADAGVRVLDPGRLVARARMAIDEMAA